MNGQRSLRVVAAGALLVVSMPASAAVDYKAVFGNRDACFVLQDLRTGKRLEELNAARCRQRLPPCSTFKVAAAVMAFERGVLHDENQVIKWDGTKHPLADNNQDLTAITWMRYSAVWVTQWIMPQLGMERVRGLLRDFAYGNEDLSGGLTTAWLMSSLTISANEQVAFLSRLWTGKLPVSPRTVDLTKKVMFVKELDDHTTVYGKTGTGCVTGHDCMSKPDRMLGWFVGVAKTKTGEYVFAANAADTEPTAEAAGPRVRRDVLAVLERLKLP